MDTKRHFLGQRHLIALWGFTFTAFINFHRQAMAVVMVAMVNHTHITTSHFKNTEFIPTESCLLVSTSKNASKTFKVEGEFNWDSRIQGYIIAVFGLSYVFSQLTGGRIAEVWGVKRTVFLSILISSLLTIITPFSAWWNFYLLIVVQVARGFALGFLCPAFFVSMANWFPRKERGMLSSFVMNGFTFGPLIGALTTGQLCDVPELGWPWAFYVSGGANCLLCIPFAIFFHELPKNHPHISKEELQYIISDQESVLTKKRPPIPWKKLLTSIPVYALCCGMFGLYWSINHFLSVHPTYLGTVLQYDMAQNGLLSSLPYLAMIFASLASSFVCNWLTKKDLLNVNAIRKGCTLVSAAGFSSCLLGVILAGCDRLTNFICFTAALLFCGIGLTGSIIVSGDMSPTFAGSIFGIAGAVANLAPAILPAAVGTLTKQETLEEWHAVFYMHIAVVMSCGIIFQIFGSAKIQPWNTQDTGKNSAPSSFEQKLPEISLQ